MRVNDIVRVVWTDSGLGCCDCAESEAISHDLVDVTSYGRLAAKDRRRLVVEHEVGRGGVGHYTVILRACVVSVTVLVPR